MTLIMLWRDNAQDFNWIASDSRLSQATHGGHIRLTDHGAKILEIPAQLRFLTPDSFDRPIIGRTNLVFAYAGSSLIALQAFAAVQPLWSRLLVSAIDPQRLPSIQDFAAHFGKFLMTYTKEVSASEGQLVKCECILAGYDSPSGLIDTWRLAVQMDCTGPVLKMERQDISAVGALVAYGSGSSEALADLAAQYGDRSSTGWGREPLNYLRERVRQESQGTVGGAVQLGVITPIGFTPMANVEPVTPGEPRAEIWHRGFPYGEIGNVGHARLDLLGMT